MSTMAAAGALLVGGKHDELTVAVTDVEQHVDQRLWVSPQSLDKTPLELPSVLRACCPEPD